MSLAKLEAFERFFDRAGPATILGLGLAVAAALSQIAI